MCPQNNHSSTLSFVLCVCLCVCATCRYCLINFVSKPIVSMRIFPFRYNINPFYQSTAAESQLGILNTIAQAEKNMCYIRFERAKILLIISLN